jgi:hypothetical protein
MFEERERGYEAKWAHDAELRFRIMARRDAGLGQWAASLMKLSAAETADYVQSVINAGLARPKADAALEKIRADLAAHGAPCADDALLDKANSLLEEAKVAALAAPKTS